MVVYLFRPVVYKKKPAQTCYVIVIILIIILYDGVDDSSFFQVIHQIDYPRYIGVRNPDFYFFIYIYVDLSLHTVIIKPYTRYTSVRGTETVFKMKGIVVLVYSYRQATRVIYFIIYTYIYNAHDEVVPRLPPSRF